MSVFSVFKTRKKEKKNETEQHYSRFSLIFMLSKYLCIILALFLLLYGFTFRADEISMDNFRYLLSFIMSDEKDVSEYKTIYYDNDSDNAFAIVRGDLAVVNSGGSAVYTMSGTRRSVDTSLRMDSPLALSSAKQLFIYDLGGTELVIKSSLETLEKKSYDYPIWAVDVTSNGVFAVVSAEKDSRSTVFVYDSANREFYKCSNGSLYTVSVSLNEDGTKMILATVGSENGAFATTVRSYSLNKDSLESELTINGEYPRKICFRKGGGFILLTNKACHFYGSDNTLLNSVVFGTESISSFALNSNGFIRVVADTALTSSQTLSYYNANGEQVLVKQFEAGVKHTLEEGGYLFTVSGERLSIIKTESGEERLCPISADTVETLPVEAGKALVLTTGSAYALEYATLFAPNTEVSQ